MKDSGVYRDGTKTCILLGTAHRRIRIIPLSDTGLDIETVGITEFDEKWRLVDYSVVLAAERYLGFAKLHGASEEAFTALQNLVRGTEVPVEERKVYSNGSQMVINISPVDGSNINVVGLVNGKVTIFSLPQKEFSEYKELKNKAKDVAKKFHNFEQIQGAEPQALRLLREVISGKSINYERKVEMAKKKAEPVVEPTAPTTKAKRAKVTEEITDKEPVIAKKRGRAAKDTSWVDANHIVVDAEKVKKGFIREYVEYAASRKSFKLKDLIKKFSSEPEERITRYFSWCVAKEIFAQQ